jgi:hypothetical protein
LLKTIPGHQHRENWVTRIFRSDRDGGHDPFDYACFEREYSTIAEARAGHAMVVEQLAKGKLKLRWILSPEEGSMNLSQIITIREALAFLGAGALWLWALEVLVGTGLGYSYPSYDHLSTLASLWLYAKVVFLGATAYAVTSMVREHYEISHGYRCGIHFYRVPCPECRCLIADEMNKASQQHPSPPPD